MVKKVGDNFEKASKDIPNALNRFNDFLNSGTIERKMSHLQSKFSSLENENKRQDRNCLLYTSPSPRDNRVSRMPSSA